MADSLSELFSNIKKEPNYYLKSKKGEDFEDRIAEGLDSLGYSRILSDDVIKTFPSIKKECQEVGGTEILKNIDPHKKHFIKQPCGKQDYPDFWVFSRGFIFSIEVKFSEGKQKKPIWNSGLPRPNGIYIFGSYEIEDITFFKGVDVIAKEEVLKLRNFFHELKEKEKEFNESECKNQKYGFAVYSRAAYDQKKKNNKNAIIDYFSNPDREKLEKNVIDYVS